MDRLNLRQALISKVCFNCPSRKGRNPFILSFIFFFLVIGRWVSFLTLYVLSIPCVYILSTLCYILTNCTIYIAGFCTSAFLPPILHFPHYPSANLHPRTPPSPTVPLKHVLSPIEDVLCIYPYKDLAQSSSPFYAHLTPLPDLSCYATLY